MELEAKVSAPGVWDDPARARALLRELDHHKSNVQLWSELEEGIDELQMFCEMASEDNPEEMSAVKETYSSLKEKLEAAETRILLSGPYDDSHAILTIHAGSGGDDAQDWAQMLLRMYLRWGEQNDQKAEVIEVSPAESGIHSATVLFQASQSYGLLRSERGVHRLVRISPFDQAKRRHTSFAKVDVVPELAEAQQVEIRNEDLKVDTYRSSGAGGQHVNKTDSAVRLTHLPTGIVVACQNERSQHSNKDTAMKILRAKLFELEKHKRQEEIEGLRGENTEAAWGYQIRNYVLHPYSVVKDRRTAHEDSNVQAVLDGKLNGYIRSYLEACARLGHEPEPGMAHAEDD